MKTLEEFKRFLDTDKDLVAALSYVEKKRKKNVTAYLIMFACGVMFTAGMFYYSYHQTKKVNAEYDIDVTGTQNTMYFIMGGIFLLSIIYSLFTMMRTQAVNQSKGKNKNFVFDFKDKVIRRIISFYDPSFRYEMNNHIRLGEILNSGMLESYDYDISGSDMIRGTHQDVSFRFSDVTLKYHQLFNQKDESEEIVLCGSVFIADFNKKFKSPVFIFPKKSGIKSLQKEGEEVRLESPLFNKLFRVYSPDQIEARYILSTSLMARIENLAETLGDQIHFVFANNNIYIINNNYSDHFEASWGQSMNKKEKLIQYYNELNDQLSIIEELKLNVKIWG